MKPRIVEFADDARSDLFALHDWIVQAASPDVALVSRGWSAAASSFDYASEWGHPCDDIQPGLRVIGFERRVTIA